MKRSILWALCLSVVTAFAGQYDISDFEATDAGSPDEYISAEFGRELKTIPADEVESIQDGRLVVRQKFVDPFGDNDPTYQLYQGSAGDLSSMTALTADGVDYSKLVSAKLYKNRGDNSDVEKVYFDGKSVFAEGLTSAIVYIDGLPVTLKGEGSSSQAAAKSSNDEECDDYDEDCEDDDEDLYKYRTSAPVDNTADERDYAASNAASDVGDRFGIADEVRFWSAVGLTALAAASIVAGVLQHKEANKAQSEYDKLAELNDGFLSACDSDVDPVGCREVLVQRGEVTISDGKQNITWRLQDLQNRMNTNKSTHDSYATARNIWFGVAGASILGAVVLFVW